MENYLWILITFLAYFIALLVDIRQRDAQSESSPVKFSYRFFFRDNKYRLLVSLLLSLSMSLLFWLVFPALAKLEIGSEATQWGVGIYILIGASPDLVISYYKRKGNFLRVDEVDFKGETYKRKEE